MIPTVFQPPEIRDGNDNIVQQGTFGKNSPLSNSTNDGWIDYVANDLNFLYDLAKDEVVPVSALPSSGDMNKTYLLTTTGVCYRWDGTAWVEISSSEAVGRAETAANLAEQWATKTNGAVEDNEYSAKHYSNVSKDWANKLNATVDGSEYSAKHYAGVAEGWAEDAENTAEDIADHLAQIDQNTGGVSANSKRIGNIEKLLQGNLYDYQTDSTSAYTKSVPSGAMPYAGLEKVGGKTVVWNQLAISSMYRPDGFTYSGLTLSHTANGFTINGTTTENNTIWIIFFNSAIIGHEYLIKGTPVHNGVSLRYANGGSYINVSENFFVTPTNSSDIYVAISFASNTEINLTWKPQIYDLTLMYGAGNEPSTVEEFQQMFPADYYAYNAGTLLSAGVTEVVSKDANNATLQTYSIPAEVQALEGYGWSAGTAYNYIDIERKKFVQNVGRVEIIASDVSLANTYTNVDYYKVSKPTNYSGYSTYKSTKTVAPIINEKFIPIDISYPPVYDSATNIGCVDGTANNVNFWFGFAKNTTLEQAKSALVGTHIYYELATPVEVDISEYLTDDNLIKVESGGTLTFENQHGDDYRLPVPSEEEYMIDLQSAIGG